MPRIRTIKPEFWTDPTMVRLSPYARLFFIGSWNFADDTGVLPNEPERLKLQILPDDPVNAEDLIDEIAKTGRYRRAITPEGRAVLVIRYFRRHQAVKNPSRPAYGNPDTFTYADQHFNENELVLPQPYPTEVEVGSGSGSGKDLKQYVGDPRQNSVADAPQMPTGTEQDTTGQSPTVSADWDGIEDVKQQLDALASAADPACPVQQLYDPSFWRSIDRLTEHTEVYYLDELRKFLLWWPTRPPSGRRRDLRRTFRNWIKTELGRVEWQRRRTDAQVTYRR